MKNRVWLPALAGAMALVGPAFAQEAAPAVPPAPAAQGGFEPEFREDPLRGLITPRVLPTTGGAKKMPEADACANVSGKFTIQERADACGKLIAAGKWKGDEIAWAYSNRCFALKKLGQGDKALADCDKAIELDGKNAVAYQTRAMIWQDRGDSDKALADFDRAEALGAKNAGLFSDRGNVLMAKGDFDKALENYNAAIGMDGRNASYLVERGGAWLAKGDADHALADYAKAVELAPGDAFAAFNRGVALYVKGDKAGAAAAFRSALKLDPKGAYPGLWLFLAQSGPEAASELKRVAEKFPQAAWPWPVVRYDLGEIDAAQVVAAAKTAGDRCEAKFYTGAAQLAKGAREDGLANLREAVASCPKNFIESISASALVKAASAEPAKAEPAKAEPVKAAEPQAATPASPSSAPSVDLKKP